METGRSIIEYRAFRACQESVHVEVVRCLIHQLLGDRRMPPQTVVQRQPWSCFPCILSEKAEPPLLREQRIRSALCIAAHLPKQEIRQTQAAELAAECGVP